MIRISLAGLCIVAFQLANSQITLQVIPAKQLAITNTQTTNIIFPIIVQSVDRGNAQLLVQKAFGAPHILQLKAASENMTPTNLSVVTADGSF